MRINMSRLMLVTCIRKIIAAIVSAIIIFPVAAHAVPVNFSFEGTVSTSILSIGSGAVVIPDGSSFVITGMTLSDTDSNPLAGTGGYAAMSTYSFPGFGEFITDGSTGEDYFQVEGAGSIVQIGLINFAELSGFGSFISGVLGPADLGVVPFGGPIIPTSTSVVSRTLTNSVGHFLALNVAEISSISVVAKVAEPESLALFALGLAGLGLMRRRRRFA